MMMRNIFLCLMVICAGSIANGQENSSQDEHQLALMPRDQNLLLIASQPDCPLKFENAQLFINMKGHLVKDFDLRNQGTKSIRAYTVAVISSGEWGWEAPDSNHYIMPGQTAPRWWEEESKDKDKIVPLTKELREKLKLQGPMKGIVVLIVVRVEYADGSVFEEKGYENQEEYFDKMYLTMTPSNLGR